MEWEEQREAQEEGVFIIMTDLHYYVGNQHIVKRFHQLKNLKQANKQKLRAAKFHL